MVASPAQTRVRRTREGGTTFHFVTDGIESALDQAKRAAGGKDVMLWGGAQAANQFPGGGTAGRA